MFSQKRTANHGPNAVSVGHLRGCWSTVPLRQDHFGIRKVSTLRMQGIVQHKVLYNKVRYCTTQSIIGNEHTFVEVFFRIMCDRLRELFGPTFDFISGAKCFMHECACANPQVQPHPSSYRSRYYLASKQRTRSSQIP